MQTLPCFIEPNVNTMRTPDSGRFRRKRLRRKGKLVLRYYEDKMTGHLYAVQEARLA